MMTSQPAALFGIRERGVVREGFAADLFVFDPATVDSEPARLVHDLPGETPRLYAGSHGVVRVLVNGVETVRDGKADRVPARHLVALRPRHRLGDPRARPEPPAPAPPSSLPPVTPEPNDPAVAVEEPPLGRPRPAQRLPMAPIGPGGPGGQNGADGPVGCAPRGAKRSNARWIREGIIVVVVAVLVAVLLRAFVVQTFFIPSGSMEPTLQIGDRILVNKLSYDLHGVDRGDIVVFSRPPAENCGGPEVNDLVKRVIGLPGETISLAQRLRLHRREAPQRVMAPLTGAGDHAARAPGALPTALRTRTTSPPTTTS